MKKFAIEQQQQLKLAVKINTTDKNHTYPVHVVHDVLAADVGDGQVAGHEVHGGVGPVGVAVHTAAVELSYLYFYFLMRELCFSAVF